MDIEITGNNRYIQKVTIPCYDTDAAFFLKPASFMDLCQELAYWSAAKFGFGYDELQQENIAWVLSRMHFKYFNPPKWRDTAYLHTWHKGAYGPFFLRDYELKDESGNVLVAATSSWLVIDLKSRSLVRHSAFDDLSGDDTICRDNALPVSAKKVVMPKGVEPEFMGSHKIAYSDIDIIGHTNNARYVLWAMDAIDYEIASSRRIKDFQINFNKETVPGEKVDIYRIATDTENGIVYEVEGMVDGKSAFCAEIGY